MGPKGWATQFSKLCRRQFGVHADRIVSFRDILESYENGETPETLIKKVMRAEVPKLVPISPPTGKPRPVFPRPSEPTKALDSSRTEYELTSPSLPCEVMLTSSSAKLQEIADKTSANPLIKEFKLRKVKHERV